MDIRFKALLGATAAILAAASAPAAVLYDNGPLNGTVNGVSVDAGSWIINSFTLASASTVSEIDVGVWMLPGDSMTSIQWGISSTPDFAHATTSDTVSLGDGRYNDYGWWVQTYSFSVADLALEAGTYYLTLASPTSTYGWVYWDMTGGPSSAYVQAWDGSAQLYDPGSEDFRVVGAAAGAAPTPEPASWEMMLGGFALVGGVLRAQRKLSVSFG